MSELGTIVVDNVWVWTSVAGIALAVKVFFLAADGLDWAPLLVMATIPVQRSMLIGTNGYQITWTQLALVAFFGGAVFRLALGSLRIRVDAIAILAMSVVCMYAISVVVAGDPGQWAGETYRWAVSMVFLVVSRAYFHRGSGQRAWLVLLIGVWASAIWASVQVVAEQGPASFVRAGLIRAHGTFGEPNPFAAFIWAITLPVIAFVIFAHGGGTRSRLTATATGGVGLLALALTQSRGGLLGAVAGLCLIAGWLLLHRQPTFRLTGFAATAVALGILIALVADVRPWSVIGEATTPGNWADQERTAHWAAAVAMIDAHPLTGVGAGGFSDHFRSNTEYWRYRISRGHAHNTYLQVAAEVGLAGLLAYALLLAVILGSLIRRAITSADAWLAIGAAAMTAALLVHQIVDYLQVLSLGLLFAGLWAAALPTRIKGNSSREHNVAT